MLLYISVNTDPSFLPIPLPRHQVRRLKRVIGLHELKTHKNGALADMALFKQSRLSVQPVKGSEWSYILDLEDKSPDAEA